MRILKLFGVGTAVAVLAVGLWTDAAYAQDQIPIYGVLPAQVTRDSVLKLAQEAFGMSSPTVTEDDTTFMLVQEQKRLTVWKASGAMLFADDSKLWNPDYEITSPADVEGAIRCAEDFLKTHDLLPPQRGPAVAFLHTLKSRDGQTEVNNHWAISWQLAPESPPPVLPSPLSAEVARAKLEVRVGQGCEIIGLHRFWRELGEKRFVPAILADQARELVAWKLRLPAIPKEEEIVLQGAYNLLFPQDTLGWLYPFYGASVSAGERQLLTQVPATPFAVLTRIVSPQPEQIFPAGASIELRAEVRAGFGSPPYRYAWYSTVDGLISQASTAQVRLSPGLHHLTLVVTDREQTIDYQTIIIEVKTPEQATIYRAHTPEPVTTAIAERLAHQLFGLEARAVELRELGAFAPWNLIKLPARLPKTESVFFVSDDSARFLLTPEGVFVFYNQMRLARSREAQLASDAQEAQAQFEEFLERHGLQLPEPGRLQLEEASLQSMELSEELEALGATEAPRYWRLRYRYELPASEHEWWAVELAPTQPERMIANPVEPFEVWLGAEGEVIMLSWLWWSGLEAVQALPMRSHDEALELAYQQLGALIPQLVGESFLLSVKDDAKLELRYLVGTVSFEFDPLPGLAAKVWYEGEKGLWVHPVYVHPFIPSPVLWLPATEFAPLIELTVSQGSRQESDLYFAYWDVPAECPIHLQTAVRGGAAPYLYGWSLWTMQSEDSLESLSVRWQGGTEPSSLWKLRPGWYSLLGTVRDDHGLSHAQALWLHANPELPCTP